jgi:hypothetical protein
MWSAFWAFIQTTEGASATTAVATIVLTLTTIVSTLTTIVYAALTWVLARENKLLRKAGTQPQVIAYIGIHPRVRGALQFILANVGQGPALDVSYQMTSGGTDFQTHEADLPRPVIPLTVIPQGERYETFFGLIWNMSKKPQLLPFSVEVTFFDLKKQKYVDTFVIDIGQFAGRRAIVDSAEQDLIKAAKDIAAELKTWTTRGLPVETATRAERRREEQETIDQLLGPEDD